ncbi:hypothetical protein ACJX0J_009174 [Zea mays]
MHIKILDIKLLAGHMDAKAKEKKRERERERERERAIALFYHPLVDVDHVWDVEGGSLAGNLIPHVALEDKTDEGAATTSYSNFFLCLLDLYFKKTKEFIEIACLSLKHQVIRGCITLRASLETQNYL